MKSKKINSLKFLYLILIFMFLYIPIIVLIGFSFNQSKLNVVWTGFTFKWYGSLLHNAGILDAVKNSFIIAIISTIISVIIGTLAAIGMYRYKFRAKKLVDAILYVPLVIPEIVMGISLLAFFSIAKIPLGRVSLIIAHVTFSIAYVVAVVKTRLDGFDRSVEEVAMDLYATPIKTFFNITLPIIMPGVIAGALLAFTLSLDDVIISFFVAGPGSVTLPLKVFSMVKFGVTPEINALSTILIILTIIIICFALFIRNVNINMKKIGAIITSILIVFGSIGGGIFTYANHNAQPEEVLNVFNWSEYLPQSVIDKFEQTYNIKVNYSTFSSNEEMLAKLMAGGGNYDLTVASDFMVEILSKQGLITPINKSSLTNLNNIGSQYLNLPFDRGNKYSVPYMWLAGVISYDSSKIPEGTIKGYKDLWKPEFKNSLTVLDDERVIIGMTLKMLGYPLNETRPAALKKAKEALIKLQPNIKSYDSDSPKTSLINGESKAMFAWGAEGNLARLENQNIKYVIPSEGLFLQQDNFVIPKAAKNVKAAQLFINFIMQPEISAEISHKFPYGNPNTAAYKYIDKKILDDKAVYPPKEVVKKGEYLKDIGKSVTDLDKIWTEVK
ncbi:extracellular solute-binding protein [Clostridium estertheticum]|uniref:Spermidine/putrescine ABC transporter permease n=1 Tax=Clostridium estertheticum subsp. estertheticum TaxID=1552 RepID=A0A1J0GGG5_9CLOT|nr:extracellular solute-binding protein [Clostridium estertheticum]APC40457.1 spermidine/putrescine ABC transporter permease [Clostridium estertheticum subsp. estertheticum]MBU3075100.1 extracellular solute-binding protein [Clostridium estertheticum]MBU3165315.1 extracellular solute-binding protein [Clostridium estertheticum]MBU3173072.1 extracellular solute-binding protein [Clostridium estertheticum]MBZ9617720.1 extracellular solute-binding protein [Clostridium estertheticum subsp. laramiense